MRDHWLPRVGTQLLEAVSRWRVLLAKTITREWDWRTKNRAKNTKRTPLSSPVTQLTYQYEENKWHRRGEQRASGSSCCCCRGSLITMPADNLWSYYKNGMSTVFISTSSSRTLIAPGGHRGYWMVQTDHGQFSWLFQNHQHCELNRSITTTPLFDGLYWQQQRHTTLACPVARRRARPLNKWPCDNNNPFQLSAHSGTHSWASSLSPSGESTGQGSSSFWG